MMTVSLPVVWTVELAAVMLSIAGSFWIAKRHIRRYAVLYAFSAVTGIVLCLAFVYAGFYSFPVKLVPYTPIPLVEMATVIPFSFVWSQVQSGKLGMEVAVLLCDGAVDYVVRVGCSCIAAPSD